jgi:hypothetical protein
MNAKLFHAERADSFGRFLCENQKKGLPPVAGTAEEKQLAGDRAIDGTALRKAIRTPAASGVIVLVRNSRVGPVVS